MIAIVNISPPGTKDEEENEYVLRINKQILFYFKHKRTDGLSACLRKAAKEAKKFEKEFKSKDLYEQYVLLLLKNLKM